MRLFSYNCMAKYKLVLHISIHKAVTESMKFLCISIENAQNRCFKLLLVGTCN